MSVACARCGELVVETTTFVDWYHQWLCAACGAEWRGALILHVERQLRGNQGLG